MSATISPPPRFRAFTSDGEPLVGGQLYTYQAGTTVPLATYHDYEQTALNTNPVILDADGEADVWLRTGLGYKYILHDANGVLQWSVDHIQSPPSEAGAGFEPFLLVGKTTVTPAAAAWVEVVPDVYPFDTLVLGIRAQVTETLGNSGGMTTFDVGDIHAADRWATQVSRVVGSTLNISSWNAYAPLPIGGDRSIVLSARTGAFDGSGSVDLYCYYLGLPIPAIPPSPLPPGDQTEPAVVHGTRTVVVTPVAGAWTMPVPALYPAGMIIDGVLVLIDVPVGGPTTLSIGDALAEERWGTVPTTSGSRSDVGGFRSYAPLPYGSDTPGLLTARDAACTGTGQLTVICWYHTFAPPQPITATLTMAQLRTRLEALEHALGIAGRTTNGQHAR